MSTTNQVTGDPRLARGTPLLKRLRRDEKLSDLQVRQITAHVQRHEVEVIDAIVDAGAMSESALFESLAQIYRTNFLTTPKVHALRIGRDVLGLVAHRLAVRLCLVPVLHDPETKTLTVLGGYPEERLDAGKQLKLSGDLRAVQYVMARPSAIFQLIHRFYEGGVLENQTPLEPGGSTIPPLRSSRDRSFGSEPPPDVDNVEVSPVSLGRISLPNVPDPESWVPPPLTSGALSSPREMIERDAFLETVNVLVTLSERGRPQLRGHSARVAAYAARLGARIHLGTPALFELKLAAYLHDLGKPKTHHLTLLNVHQYEGHRSHAERTYMAPVQMFRGAALPEKTKQALEHLYEHFDGSGFPKGLEGSAIPLQSRVIALLDTFADLTSHKKNPFGRKLKGPEAIRALRRFSGSLFDPALVDALAHLVLGAALKSQSLNTVGNVLIADSDPEGSLVLELRLLESGYAVYRAPTAAEVKATIRDRPIDMLVAETELGPDDGFALLRELKSQGELPPVIIVSTRDDRESVKQGMQLGAVDYVIKPAAPEVVVAKVDQALSRRSAASRGVAGSIEDMALTDVVQILAGGGKSGALRVSHQGTSGGLYFKDGSLWAASFAGQEGTDAFVAIMSQEGGDFEFDPAADVPSRNLQDTTESLLLEAMRRIDEAGA